MIGEASGWASSRCLQRSTTAASDPAARRVMPWKATKAVMGGSNSVGDPQILPGLNDASILPGKTPSRHPLGKGVQARIVPPIGRIDEVHRQGRGLPCLEYRHQLAPRHVSGNGEIQ